MAETRASPAQNIMSSPVEDITVEVEQQKLSREMQDYIKALAASKPFAADTVVDAGNVMIRLERFWPELPGWEAQAARLWQEIDNLVHSIPALPKNAQIVLRVAIASSKLIPGALPEPQESAVVATFDTIAGVERRYIVPSSDQAQVFDTMGIPAGLMLVCQPMLPLINPIGDNRRLGMGAGDLYNTERVRDKRMTANEVADIEAERKSIVPGPAPVLRPQEVMSPVAGMAAVGGAAAVGTSAMVGMVRNREERPQIHQSPAGSSPASAEVKKEMLGPHLDRPYDAAAVKSFEATEIAMLAEKLSEVENEITASEREPTQEMAAAESKLRAMEAQQEEQILSEMPQRPESVEFAEIEQNMERGESADVTETETEVSQIRAEEDSHTSAGNTSVLEESESLYQAGEGTIKPHEEVSRSEGGQENVTPAKLKEEQQGAEYIGLGPQPPVAETQKVSEASRESFSVPMADLDPVGSVVEQNIEEQQKIGTARQDAEEARQREEYSASIQAPPQQAPGQDAKDTMDEIKEKFERKEPREERKEENKLHDPASSLTHMGSELRNRISFASNGHAYIRPFERPFRHHMTSFVTAKDTLPSGRKFVTRRFAAKTSPIGARLYEGGSKAFGAAMMAPLWRIYAPHTRLKGMTSSEVTPLRKKREREPLKKKSMAKKARQNGPRVQKLEELTLQK